MGQSSSRAFLTRDEAVSPRKMGLRELRIPGSRFVRADGRQGMNPWDREGQHSEIIHTEAEIIAILKSDVWGNFFLISY